MPKPPPPPPQDASPEILLGLPILPFASQADWRAWLDAQHATAKGVWLRIYKKGSAQPTVSYAEALDEALCYGWIDSTKRSYDEASFLQRFTPRKPKGPWSQINREHVARLEAAGKMQPAGKREVEAAKADGRWDAAYAPQSTMAVPPDLQAALDANPAAQAFFDTLNKANRYAFLHRVLTAKKPETRARRVAWAVEMMGRQEKLH